MGRRIKITKDVEIIIKLIASDMDGTLLNEYGELDKEFFEVFNKLMKKDIRFVVASGRQYSKLNSIFKAISDDIIYIAENGTIVKYKEKELYSSTLNREDAMELIKEIQEIQGIFIVLCGKNCAYVNTDKQESIEEVEKYYSSYKIVEDFTTIDDEFIKIAVYDTKGVEANSLPVLLPKWKDRYQLTASSLVWLDIYNKEANKGIAISMIQEKYGITREETMVFGDYFNDVEMLKAAHHSYAMENAPSEVKKHANFIAKSNMENGVLEAIKKVVLKVS